MRRLAWLTALLLSACAADDTPRTQVVVIIDAEQAVKEQAADLALIVTDLSDGTPRPVHDDSEAPSSRKFPHRIALVPTGDDAARTYRLEAHAVTEKRTVAVARLISGYVASETRYVRIVLEDACIGQACSPDETCHAGTCVPAESPPEKFATDEARAPLSTTVRTKGARPASEPQPEHDADAPDPSVDEMDAMVLPVGEDAGLPMAEVEGGLPSEQDAAPPAPDASPPDAAARDASVDAQVADSGPVQGVCGGNTPQGCYRLVPATSAPTCPAYHPGTTAGLADCLGMDIYLTCNFSGPQGQSSQCLCDWYHWLCT